MNDVANIGSEVETSILEMARIIINITGSSSKILHLPPLVEGDMARRKPDIFIMRKLLNREMTTLQDGIKRVLGKGDFSH